MQLSRRELLMLEGSRRYARSKGPKVAYAFCVVGFVFAALALPRGVWEFVTRTDGSAGNTMMTTGVILALMTMQLFLVASYTSNYGTLIGKLQGRIDELEAERPPVPTA